MITEYWGQFVIARDHDPVAPTHFLHRIHLGWQLRHHASLRLHEVHDRVGRVIGFVLGHVIDRRGWRPEDEAITFDFPTDPKAADEAVANLLDGLHGRFILVLNAPTGPQVYLDSGGTLSVVYRTDVRRVASSTTLANFDRFDDFVADRLAAGPVGPNQFFPAGLTGASNTRRLMPNHVLEFDRSTQRRYWPTRPIPEIAGRRAMVKATHQIMQHIRTTLIGASKVGMIHVGLTAGRDSRVLAACARPIVDQVEFHTFAYNDPDKAADVQSSKDLAARLDVRHRVLELTPPTDASITDYCRLTGYDANSGKAADFHDAWLRYLPREAVTLNGYGGEVGRGYYYRSGIPTAYPSAADLLNCMHLPGDDINLAAMSEWVAGVPKSIGPALMYDLAYWEHRAGCWATPQMYGAAPSRMYLAPIQHRNVLVQMLRFPVDLRRRQYVPQIVVGHAWGSASAIPYNGNIRLRESMPKRARRIARQLVDSCLLLV